MPYYSNANPDLLSRTDLSARHILEIGAGSGGLARAIKARIPDCTYTSVEYVPEEAEQSQDTVEHLIVGDIENANVFKKLEDISKSTPFDLLLIGDVLEHLWDPWGVMRKLKSVMAPDGSAKICIPNVAHYSLIMRQLSGDWTYTDSGLLDRTHKRFFTKSTTAKMFTDAGWHVENITGRVFNKPKAMKVIQALQSISEDIGVNPKTIEENLLPLQWVFSISCTERPKPKQIRSVGINSQTDSLLEIRMRQPLRSISSTGKFRWNETIGNFPTLSTAPGILHTCRLHPRNQNEWDHIHACSSSGWLFLHDLDDHPAYLNGQKKNDFRSIKSAHTVLASTEHLARIAHKWNDDIVVLPNQIYELPPYKDVIAKKNDSRLKVFIGGLNRDVDWAACCADFASFNKVFHHEVEFVVVHNEKIASTLQVAGENVTFYAAQPYLNYLKILSSCDIALLPLADTEFNNCKSELKVLECFANGVVPVCSPTQATLGTLPKQALRIANTSEEWAAHIHDFLQNSNTLLSEKQHNYDYIATKRMWSHHVEKVAAIYNDLWHRQPELQEKRMERMRAWNLPEMQ